MSAGRTVLVVDDDADIRRALRRALRGRYRVLWAADGHDGISLARAERPALIILDLLMPGMDGHTAVQLLRLDPRTRGIPVIMCSGVTDAANAAECVDAGADAYFTKPLDLEDLKGWMESLMRRRPSRGAPGADREAGGIPS